MKVGDVGTELTFVIKDQDGNFVDLSAATRVTLVMQSGAYKLERQCSVVDAAQGKVKYVIGPGDLVRAGPLYMEVRIEFIDGDIYTTTCISEIVEAAL